MSEIQKYEQQSHGNAVSIFTNAPAFEQAQRIAKMLTSSTLVPAIYRTHTHDKKTNEWTENPGAIANAMIALNVAHRTGEDPLMVMQNLDVIEGRPAWNSKYTIARLNRCGMFSEIEFEFEELGTREVEYTETTWNNNQKTTNRRKVTIDDKRCRAYATKLKTGKQVNGPWVSMEIAVKEGWYTKNGSKWQTMPDLMLMYRAAKWFANVNAPEVLLGMPSADEVADVEYTVVDSQPVTPSARVKTLSDLPAAPAPLIAPAVEPSPKVEKGKETSPQPAAKRSTNREQSALTVVEPAQATDSHTESVKTPTDTENNDDDLI